MGCRVLPCRKGVAPLASPAAPETGLDWRGVSRAGSVRGQQAWREAGSPPGGAETGSTCGDLQGLSFVGCQRGCGRRWGLDFRGNERCDAVSGLAEQR